MAKKKAKKTAKKKTSARRKTTKRGPVELIISKSRTKNASKLNVSGDFYGALDGAVRSMIKGAEGRASANGRKTLRPQDL
jgi:histone H3/H4